MFNKWKFIPHGHQGHRDSRNMIKAEVLPWKVRENAMWLITEELFPLYTCSLCNRRIYINVKLRWSILRKKVL